MKFFYLFSFLSLLFLVGTVSAADLNFPYNSAIDIKRPCFNNGTFCSPLAICNLTVIYPDSGILLNNQPMTNQVSYHNITVGMESVNQLGIHSAIMTCYDPSGDIVGNGDDTFTVEITADGNTSSVFPIQFSILILGVFFIIVGKFREDLRLIKHLGSIIVLVMGVVTLYPGYSFLNYSNLQGMVIGFSTVGFK